MATLAVLELNPDFRIGQVIGTVEVYRWPERLQALLLPVVR
jgi:hypothetical protein